MVQVAWTSTDCGTARSGALAVPKLMTKSNFDLIVLRERAHDR
jgi:hypothetical protein